MIMFLRHLIATVVLPFTMAVVIPVWIARGNVVILKRADSLTAAASQLAGAALLAIGVMLFTASLHNFAVRGRGTLAPWDPPRMLVVDGPYRYVRNPMIAGVIFVLFSEAVLLQSAPHLNWAIAFAAINAVYIPLIKEPLLEARFGEPYREYRRHVRRFIPRVRPWSAT